MESRTIIGNSARFGERYEVHAETLESSLLYLVYLTLLDTNGYPMFYFKTIYLLCLLAVPAFGSVPASVKTDPRLHEDKSIYDSPLLGPNGTEVSISQFADGNPLAVIVMKGNWCFACTDELRRLDSLRNHWRQLGVKILALNTESARKNQSHQIEMQSSIPIFSDPDGELLNKIGFYLPERGHPFPGVLFFDACGQWVHTI